MAVSAKVPLKAFNAYIRNFKALWGKAVIWGNAGPHRRCQIVAGYHHTLCARLYQIMTSVRALNILILNHCIELQRIEKQSNSGDF